MSSLDANGTHGSQVNDPNAEIAMPAELPFDTVIVPAPLPEGWNIGEASGSQIGEAERLEYEVFRAAGFCEETGTHRTKEFEPWRDVSAFQVVTSPDGTIQGTVRVMIGDYDTLPVGSFERIAEYPPDPVLEYASLALAPDQRRMGVAEALYRAVWLKAVRHNTGGIVAISEDWLIELLNANYGFGFMQLGAPRWYMGGECFPMGIALPPLLARMKNQPAFLRWLTEVVDLRDVAQPSYENSGSSFKEAVTTVRRTGS